jgi:hypothetical protein
MEMPTPTTKTITMEKTPTEIINPRQIPTNKVTPNLKTKVKKTHTCMDLT